MSHAVDVAFVAAMAGLFGVAFWSTRDDFFFLDDWLLLRQSGHIGGLLEDYSGHLSILILGLYRGLAEVFGLRYAPFQVAALLSLFAVPAGYYLATRRTLGAPIAALLGLALFAPEHVWLMPAEANHFLALAAGIACAAALDRGESADGWLATGLVLSLAAAGGGVAVAAACVAHRLCLRASPRRWIPVLLPVLVWSGWWLVVGRRYDEPGVDAPLRTVAGSAWEVVTGAFDALALHQSALGGVLVVAYLAYGAWVITRGLEAAANWLAWTTALACWAVGVATSRGILATAETSRYQFVAIGFVLLAIVPRRQPAWVPRLTSRAHPITAVALAGVVLLAGAARMPSLARDTPMGELVANAAPLNRGRVVVVQQGPGAIADATELPAPMGWVTVGDVRALLDRYGYPSRTRTADEELVRVGAVQLTVSRSSASASCAALTEPFEISGSTVTEPVVLRAPQGAVDVGLRRFGEAWVEVATIRRGEMLRIRLPSLESPVPWEIRATGACR